MKLEVQIDSELLADVEKLAAETGHTVTEVIERSLRIIVLQHAKRGKGIKLQTFGGGGIQPGVDLSCNAALQDMMDEYDGVFRKFRATDE